MISKFSISFALIFSIIFSVQAQSEATLFQTPTVNKTNIVFAYAGDLWIVGRDGGDAKRLTTGVGIERDPYFSPDGNTIAFTGEYDGNTDVYTVPAIGGVPKRLTFHPSPDRVSGWSANGERILMSSNRESYSNFSQLFTISATTNELPQQIPLPTALRGSLSPDSNFIAYEPLSQWQGDWKRYAGGQTQPILIAKLADSTIERVPRENSNDKCPMWIGDKIYFLSDRNKGVVSLFSFDTKSKRIEQVYSNSGLDIKHASSNGNTIAIEQFGAVYLLEAGSKTPKKVNIRVVGDFPAVRPRYERVGSRISASSISPTGSRAVFAARGEIISVPAEKGDPRNLTNSTGMMERDPAWSPDGKFIAYFSDASGEYQLHLEDQTGIGEVKKLPLGDKPAFFNSPVWSPDSKKIAYTDNHVNLWVLNVENGKNTKIDSNTFADLDDVLSPSWSLDSKWITYAKQLDNRLRAVFIYSFDQNKSHQVTDGLSDARYPVFDKSGKYIFFAASTDVGPKISFADLSGIDHQTSRSVYAIVLRNDIPSPLAPESDEEKIAPEKKDEPKPTPTPMQTPSPTPSTSVSATTSEGRLPTPTPTPAPTPPKKEVEPIRVDLEGIDQRIISIPQIPTRDFAGLVAGKAGTLYILEIPQGPPPATPFGFGLTVHKFDLDKRKLETPLTAVTNFDVSANGEKMIYQQGPAWFIVSTIIPSRPGEGSIKTSEMEVYVDPRAEWKQMFNEIWRGQRDFFYDPNMHGLDLEKAKKLYEPYVNSVAHREDLNYLFREMLNQIGVGHMFISGGDVTRPNPVFGGLLGADFKIENGRYRFAKIFNGENWNPNLRAPLTAPGVNVKVGDYLIAVNGNEVKSSDEIYRFFESTANKQVIIKVSATADGKDARNVTVVPTASEQGLRNLAWVEGNRRKVSELSSGKLGYVYIPNTSGGGFTSFNRYFFSQTDKYGAVIDERWNSGGLLADYVAEILSRNQLAKLAFRDGKDWNVPAGAIYGPKAMIINENAGSGGDAMPWFFKKLKVGALVGKRTWGGLVRSSGMQSLMDGGRITAPNGAVYGLNGEWEVENVGVAPDIEVELDPALWRQGRDLQLEKAVEYCLEELRKNPPKEYKRPDFPNYHKDSGLGKP